MAPGANPQANDDRGQTMKPYQIFIIILFTCVAISSIFPGAAAAQSVTPTIGWAMTQAELDNTYVAPNDNEWLSYSIIRGGDTRGTVEVRCEIVEQTLSAGSGPGQYELLITNPIVFGPGEVLSLVQVRFHPANHDLFGRQHLTLRLIASGATVPSGQEARTIYVEYPAAPGLGFASPPDGGYAGYEGQSSPVLLNITKEGDIYADTYADLFVSGTATNGIDYTLTDGNGMKVAIPGTIHMPPGQPIYSLYVIPLSDTQNESNETAVFTLDNLRNAVPGSMRSATVTIHDRSQAMPPVTPSPAATVRPSPVPLATNNTPAGTSTPAPLPSSSAGTLLSLVAITGAAIYLASRE